jgi:subtilisin family serine protease
VAPFAALVVVRVDDLDGITEGMNWIAENMNTYGIEIVSMSLSVPDSGGDYDAYAQLADRLVYYYGLVVVCAAGNTNYGPIVRSPGTGRLVITVGNAIDPTESVSGNWELNPTSCSGPVEGSRIKPDVLAPGTNIMAAKAGTLNQYIEYNGTSMATPFVAGLVALWLDENMNLADSSYGYISDPKVKNLLMASATDMPYDSNPGKDNSYGAGRIDAWDELLFYITDKSSAYSDAPTAITKSWSDKHYYHTDEPLWAGDPSGMADWYKVLCYPDIFIYAQVSGDPDLVLVVSIWDENPVKKAESAYGRIRNVGYWSTYEGAYYVKVEVYKNGNLYSGQVSGDFYDVHIMTTLS